MLNINKVKPLLLFFAIVFSLIAIAQYFYVMHESISTEFDVLEDSAKDLNRAINYNNGSINLDEYDKQTANVSDYFVVLSDGAILDIYPVDTNLSSDSRINEINSFLPPVICPVLGTFDKPFTVTYQTQSTSKEKWRILAKKLKGGTVILGISEF